MPTNEPNVTIPEWHHPARHLSSPLTSSPGVLTWVLLAMFCLFLDSRSVAVKKKRKKNPVAQNSSILERAVNPAVWNPINTVVFLRGGSVYLSDLLSFCSDFFLTFSKNLSREEKKDKLGFCFSVADLNIELHWNSTNIFLLLLSLKTNKTTLILNKRTWKTFCRPVWKKINKKICTFSFLLLPKTNRKLSDFLDLAAENVPACSSAGWTSRLVFDAEKLCVTQRSCVCVFFLVLFLRSGQPRYRRRRRAMMPSS